MTKRAKEIAKAHESFVHGENALKLMASMKLATAEDAKALQTGKVAFKRIKVIQHMHEQLINVPFFLFRAVRWLLFAIREGLRKSTDGYSPPPTSRGSARNPALPSRLPS
jgi:hypothetical protein